MHKRASARTDTFSRFYTRTAYVYTRVHTYLHTHIHAHTYTYVYIYMHAVKEIISGAVLIEPSLLLHY